MQGTGEAVRAGGDEATLLDYGGVVWRYKWLILAVCIVAGLGTLVVTLRTPKVYESTVTLLTPKEGGAGGVFSTIAASGILQQLPGLSLPSLTPNRDVLVSVLKSRRLAQPVVEKFRLQERYQALHLQDAIATLQALTTISISKEGVISIKVEETEPALTADIANSYVEELDRLIAQFGSGEMTRQRAFIGEQLALAKRNLEVAEDSLRRFQERNRAIVLQEQTRGAIEAVARLKGEIMASEVQLQVMRNFATDGNPEVVSLKRRLEEMKRQFAQMQYGDEFGRGSRGEARGGSRAEIYVPFAKVPEIGLELARQTRDVKVQDTLVTLLTQQYEQARIAEAKDMPLVQVLDRAVPAVRHSKPKVRSNLAMAGAVGLFVGVFLAFLLEYIQNPRSRHRRA